MNKHLQKILDFIQQSEKFTAEEKILLTKAAKDTDSALTISEFKLERTEKVKRTTAILLEETIEELENKRKAVEAQNRELEIETALERVRTVAMAMRKPADLLDICKIVYTELQLLGFIELRNAMINIHNDDKSSLLNYDYADNSGKTVTDIPYNFHPLVEKQVLVTKNAQDAFFEFSFAGEELKQFRELRKNNGEQDDHKLEITDALHYYFFSIGTGSIGISTYNAITENKLELLKRFRNVFNLSYQRYTDITLAETQAREALIELGLERVRARAMAMQKSGELSDLVDTFLKELTKLDFALNWCIINIIDEPSLSNTVWAANPDIDKKPESYNMMFEDYPFHHAMMKGYRERRTKQVYVLEGEEKKIYDEYLFNETEFRKVSAAAQAASRAMEKYVVNFTFSNFGGLQTVGNTPLSDTNIDILSRFGKVFDLTYTRFNDLQQAEAQARESQIQLALERVRARTMAMQHSNELADASFVLDTQVRALGIKTWGCAFNIYGDNESSEWFSSAEGTLPTYKTPREHLFLRYYEAGQSGEKIYIKEFAGEECAVHYEYLCTIPIMGDSLKEMIAAGGSFPSQQVDHVVYFKYGYLLFITLEPVPEAHDIFIRFAKVFEQTYTRFLDLQKAEAQAREAQIETALERVRAVAMAMRKPGDLSGISETLYNQLRALEFNELRNAEIIINKDENESILSYYCDYGVNGTIEVGYKINSILKNWAEQLKKSNDAFVEVNVPENEMEQWRKFREQIGYKPDQKLNEAKTVYYYSYSIGVGALSISSFTAISKEQVKILEKFRNVFNLSYQRYNDIANAEAQAREAQIETALERVRSRSMGMQKSDELQEVIRIVYEQFIHLKINLDHAGFVVDYTPKGGWNFWIADKQEIPSKITHPYFDSVWANQFNEAKEKGLVFFETNLDFEEKNKFYRELLSYVPGMAEETKNFYLTCPAVAASTALSENVSLYIENFSGIPYLDEENAVLMRFAKVFEQTYTRFLDLQKAEAQARESQIQLALERARTQSMIMQHSTELDDTLRVFHEQVLELNIPSAFSFLWLPDEDKDQHIFWAAWAENISAKPLVNHNSTIYKSKAINYPLDRNEPATAQCLVDWKSNEPVYSYHVPPAAVENYFAVWHALIDGVEHLKPQYFSGGLHYVEAFMKYGCFGVMVTTDLTGDEKKLLNRFAVEFERTYTRFLDLQKAEAQAREAQIEAALEKVRSRSLAMHKSDELKEAGELLWIELGKLGIESLSSGYVLMDSEEKIGWTYAPNPATGKIAEPLGLSHTETKEMGKVLSSWKKQEPLNVVEMNEEETIAHQTFIAEKALQKDGTISHWITAERLIALSPKRLFLHNFNFKQGYLLIVGGNRLTDKQAELMLRFTKVFQQTYTRFLDLKKAEAQAREAQVELALERVRARTMAMQKSDELVEASDTMFHELRTLQIDTIRVGIGIIDTVNDKVEIWSRFEKNKKVEDKVRGIVPASVSVVFDNMLKSKKEKKSYTIITLLENEVKKHYQTLSTFLSYQPQEVYNKKESFHSFYFAEGSLNVVSYEQLNDEECNIMLRFAKVFGQMYRRFLDLQKAEAQAREAQIELALERVRARTMAMQRSEELLETAYLLSQQFQNLGESVSQITIGIFDEENGMIDFSATDLTGNKFNQIAKGSINEQSLLSKLYAAWKEKRTSVIIVLTGDELAAWVKYRNTMSGGNDTDYAGSRYVHIAFFSKGLLSLSTLEPASKQVIPILERFAGVFDSTYTRFLDLQKAEAQAREAQIEVGLERVRSKAMAMHKSNELAEVVQVVFEQLQQINFNIDTASFSLNYKDYPFNVWMAAPNQPYPSKIEIPDADISIMKCIRQVITEGLDFFATTFNYEEKNQWLNHVFEHTIIKYATEERKNYMRNAAGISISISILKHIALTIGNYAAIPYTEEENEILKRFAKVFEQAYTRFLDLQKAEAQAKEATIEVALERVRASTMAMHSSEDVVGASSVLLIELGKLGIETLRCGILIIDENETFEVWAVTNTEEGKTIRSISTFNINEHPLWQAMYKGWKQKQEFLHYYLAGEEKKAYYSILSNKANYLSLPINELPDQNFQGYNFPEGTIWTFSLQPHSEEDKQVMKRFTAVFSLTFRRYRDLQKAEAQAKEAQIEAALERVRSKTMAMHNSKDVGESVAALFDELTALNILTSEDRCGIGIMQPNEMMELWTAEKGTGKTELTIAYLNMRKHTLLKNVYQNWLDKKETYQYILEGEDKLQYYEAMRNQVDYKIRKDYYSAHEKIIHTDFFFKEGCMYVFSLKEFTAETSSTFSRFVNVFGQTYRRYLDLQKAEAQAREAQIEAALERVRSKTMTMHNSQDVGDTVATMFDELVKLGIEKTIRCGIVIVDDTKQMEVWNASDNGKGKINLVIGHLDMTIHPALLRVYEAWENKQPEISYEFIGEDLKDYFRAINNSPEYPFQMDIASLPARSFLSDFFFADGAIFAFTHDAIAAETTQIFKRFAAVFGQTYRRYLDLLKAEAQAREAQIEVSLERVRAQTMAMNKSQDLQQVVSVIFRELDKLDLKTIRCGICIVNAQNRTANIWTTTTTTEGAELSFSGNESMDIHPVHKGTFEAWQKQEDFYYVLEGEDLIRYYNTQKGIYYKLTDAAAWVTVSEEDRQYYFVTCFPAGGIFCFRLGPFSDGLVKIIRRFASAFNLAYKRFEDLKQSEARALEVIKESSLDRVRAETASMRTTADLERITPLIWNELTTLGVPFIRCGVFIIDDIQQQIHTFLSTPAGKAIAAFHLPYNISEQITQVVIHWRQNKMYRDYWDENAFDEWTNTLVKKGIMASQEKYVTNIHPANLHLHFLPFLQGMLYVGSDAALSEEEILLIQSLAGAFSSAYARYEDFNKLELAKEQIEKTLVDLKLAQTQLVQSEKMASLGELTAGIAHEIQNPLNFVNNFSEVSRELIDELKVENGKIKSERNEQLQSEILNDLDTNLEKINHHGKRADAIVKGMLQHSQASTGQKELTDINALCDEYLRLAYHGLRAKDKSFNATLQIEYDETIGNINIIPQNIGRVLLNLYNNAFYALNEKNKPHIEGYEPIVTVATKKEKGKIIITVKDNGNGIPQKIVDKIFQPFFTTKPTGQGTGLGLSLAYDIIKAHGGEIKVETKEKEGSTFIVQIPVA